MAVFNFQMLGAPSQCVEGPSFPPRGGKSAVLSVPWRTPSFILVSHQFPPVLRPQQFLSTVYLFAFLVIELRAST
jgi:hypothetical protein